jgi:hypothetical protein
MSEDLRKYDENVEYEVYRNTPFEYVATAVSEPSMNVVTTVVTRPKGSWIITEATHVPPSVSSKRSPAVAK